MQLQIPIVSSQSTPEAYLNQIIEINSATPGFSLRWLAQKIGWPNSLITEVRQGNRTIPFNRLIQLGQALELDLTDIETLAWLSLCRSEAPEISKFAQSLIDTKFRTNSGLRKQVSPDGNSLTAIELSIFEYLRELGPQTESLLLTELPLLRKYSDGKIQLAFQKLKARNLISYEKDRWKALSDRPYYEEVKSIRAPELETEVFLDLLKGFLNSDLRLGRMINGFATLTPSEFMDVAKQMAQLLNLVEQIQSRRPKIQNQGSNQIQDEKNDTEVFQYQFSLTQFSKIRD